MKNIVFARIDERLLHGQGVTAWVGDVGCTQIYVIDDLTAKNMMIVGLYRKLAPPGTACDVISVQKAIEILSSEPSNKKEKVMLLVKIPQVLEALIDAGIKLENVNLGGMGLNNERKPFIDNVSASSEEIASMSRMIDKGVNITYQVAPYSKATDVSKVINKFL